MEPTKQDVVLVKKAYTCVLIDENVKQSRSVLLCSGTGQHFNFEETFAKENFTEDDKNVIAETAAETSKILIEMLLKWDGKSYKVCLRIGLSPTVIGKLNGILIDPKLCIRGEFIISYRIGYQTSPFLNPGYKFRVSTALVEEQSTEHFEGSSYINDLMNGDYIITDIHIYHSVSLEWKTGLEWKGEKQNVLEQLWNNKIMMDCVIVSSNQAEIRCHRSILAAHSDVLFAMLTCGLQESQTNKIHMEGNTEKGIIALVQYFYKNELDDQKISFEIAFELLQMAHKYNISKLEVNMLNILFRKPEEWFSLENANALYFQTNQIAEAASGNDSYCYGLLRDRMLNVLKRLPRILKLIQIYKENMEEFSHWAELTSWVNLKEREPDGGK